MKKVLVSGGFDPLHPGHLELFRHARQQAGFVTVIVDSDEWLSRKHQVVLPQDDRVRIISELRCVDECVAGTDPNGNDSEIIRRLRPDEIWVGPDYGGGRSAVIIESATCRTLGIPIRVFQGDKRHSSSDILKGRKWCNPPVTVGAILTNAAGKTLVVRRADRDRIEFPGGFLDVGETLEGCLRRELMEELEVEPIGLTYAGSVVSDYPADGRTITEVYFRGCIDDQTPRITDTDELAEVIWLDFGHIPAHLREAFDCSEIERMFNRCV